MERIEKALNSMENFNQKSRWHEYDLINHTKMVIKNIDTTGLGVKEVSILMKAAMLHDIGKITYHQEQGDGTLQFIGHADVSAEMADEIMREDGISEDVRNTAVILIKEHEGHRPATEKSAKKLVKKIGLENSLLLVRLQKADCLSHGHVDEDIQVKLDSELAAIDALTGILLAMKESEQSESEPELTIKDLAVNGKDLKEAGMNPGPEFKQTLDKLLNLVKNGKVKNSKEALLAAL